MRIIINESLLQEKKHRKPISERGKGGDFLYHMTRGTAMLKWQRQMAVKVFSLNLVILKNKIMYFWLEVNYPSL